MRPRSAAIIACRVISIVFGTQAIAFVVGLLSIGGGNVPGEIWAIPLTMLLIAISLWVGAVSLSAGMARGTEGDPGPSIMRPLVSVHAVALSIVGVVLIAETIPALVGVVAASRSLSGLPTVSPLSGTGLFESGREGAIAGGIVQMIIGAVLIVASGDIARALSRRYPDQEPPPNWPAGPKP